MRLSRRRFAAAALVGATTRAAAAPDFTIPAAWTNTTLVIPKAERIQLAQAGFAAVNGLYDTSRNAFGGKLPFYDTGRLVWTMALADSIAGTAEYQSEALNVLLRTQFTEARIFPAMSPPFDLVSTIAYYGIAATQAYRAYNDSKLLDLAETLWANVSGYQISPSQAQSRTHPTRNVAFQETCDVNATLAASVAGAVFSELLPSSLTFDQATSALLLLSAHLAELTQNTTYTAAATLSAQFISSVMLDPGTGLVIDFGTLGSEIANVSSDASVCNLKPPFTPLRPYGTGMYIESLAILASVDAENASKWNGLMADAVLLATQNDVWFGHAPVVLPGVLNFPFGAGSNATTESLDDRTYNGRLVQGLYAAYNRTGDAGLRAYLGAFIGTQVNALLAYATQPDSNVYTTNWAGPPPPLGALVTGDLGGQISALCALTGALAISDADPAAPSGAGAGSASAAPGATAYGAGEYGGASTHSALGLELGLGLGLGLAVLAMLVGACFVVRSRSRRRRHARALVDEVHFNTKLDRHASAVRRAVDGAAGLECATVPTVGPAHRPLPLEPGAQARWSASSYEEARWSAGSGGAEAIRLNERNSGAPPSWMMDDGEKAVPYTPSTGEAHGLLGILHERGLPAQPYRNA